MLSTLQQHRLRLDDKSVKPLCDIKAAMVLLNENEDNILYRIHTGSISFAFNIASSDARRMDVVIWVHCIAAIQQNQPQPNLSLHDVIRHILPHDPWPSLVDPRNTLRARTVADLFNTSSDHIHNLCARGSLVSLDKSSPGPNGSPRITRASIISFLTSRRIL